MPIRPTVFALSRRSWPLRFARLLVAGALLGAPSAKAASQSWWEKIPDPQLKAAVQRTLANNPELSQSQLRIELARNTAREMLTPMLPTLGGELGVNVGPLRSLGFQFGASRNGGAGGPTNLPTLYAMGSATLRANLQVDLGGRDRLARKDAKRDIETKSLSQAEERERLVLQVVTAYLDATTARAQLAALARQIQTAQSLLETTARRVELGDRSALDVLAQKQQLARVRAQVPLAQLQLEAFLAQLARLRGESPGQAYPTPSQLDPQAWLALAAPPQSKPEAQRGVRIAQRQAQSAQLQETRAKRSWVPSLQVGAQAGLQGRYLGSFFTQEFWQLNATLSVPIYQGGRVRNQREKARLQREQAQRTVRQVTLDAQQRWANLQSQLRLRKANLSALKEQEQAAQLAADEGRRRYLGGTSNYLNVLSALNALSQVQLQVITAQRELIAVALSLHSFAANVAHAPTSSQ